ncbi:MAG: bifunctional DNA-formamidopyrimidine glycosylase/DNA-(apurinic or apyrimidinic site) lyase [Candidatus Omnitrophica bacterium]|jgi:formamidopyrimidine-DNA glycosylase|nr:bifunctional DNA-formamidopyrimidine glycosylase/DNA-(apurinic or apyrimidinic site) lyase [Candidatus Omnitrophota bacterium]
MPELPEVETIRRALEKTILGKKFTEVCVHNPAIIRGIRADKFKKDLTGSSIKSVLRKGKALILELSNGKSLLVHLKMTGQLVLRLPLSSSPEQAKRAEGLVYPGAGKHARVIFHLSSGQTLDFNDQRLFAELRLLDDWRDFKFIQNLGPEPADIAVEDFKKMLSLKKTKIKPLLMDQSFISGIGNLYAAEALFRSRIDPGRPASSLSGKEKELLYKEIKETLNEAIQHKGSSIDDYVQLTGEAGDYAKYHKVYGRQNKPCLVCKTPIKRIALGGRGTYFCPKCQK